MKPRGLSGRMTAGQSDIPVWAASISLNVLSLLMPISILLIFDRIIPFQSVDTLRVLTVVLLVSAVLELILRQCRAILLSAAAEDAAVSNFQRFMTTVITANTLSFSKVPASTYTERFGAIGQLRDHQAGQGQTLLIDLPFTLLFAVLIGLIGGWLVLVPLGAFCTVTIFAAIMKRAQWHLFRRRKSIDTRRYAFLSEILTSMQTVKVNRMEPQMTRRFEMLESQTVDMSRKLIQFSGFAQNFGAIFSQMTVAAMGLLGAYLVINNLIGIAEMAACMLLNGRIVQPLTKLMALWVQSENVAISRSRLGEMDSLQTVSSAVSDQPALTGRIEINDVSMKRLNGSGHSFGPIRFRGAPSVGVLIEAEKSWMVDELFDALSGQRMPDQGEVWIDERPAVQRAAQRGQNAMVMLEAQPAILSGTLLQNLSAFGDAAMVERAKTVAAALGLEKRIHRLPLGYNTPLNTGTAFEKDPVNRQMIALTRALALQPRILLMNEPTAVLDTAERQALADYLMSVSPRLTLIIASPDPRMKNLTQETVRLRSSAEGVYAEWELDTTLEQTAAKLIRRGAA